MASLAIDPSLPPPASAPAEMLLRKLGHHLALRREERIAVDQLLGRSVRSVAARTAFVEDGAAPGEVSVMVDGWAYREAVLPDGRRRITGICLPGDLCDFDALIMTAMDGALVAATPARIASLTRESVNRLSQHLPRVARALWWESLMSAAIQRAWTINVGRRAARERIAHLFCELRVRLGLVGQVEEDGFELPMTQADIADACGLTPVHTNRALQEMRGQHLIELGEGRLTLPDPAALAAVAGFDPAYLPIEALRSARNPQIALPLDAGAE